MAVNRDQLFAELEALSEDEIETGLDAGVWGEDKRQLVEHYLDQLKLTTMQLEATTSAKEAAVVAAAHAKKATSIAFAGLIIAAGAMLAAMASAFVAFLALRN
jgi:uncharacterized protein involved in exopolysaccharide biosynthesis